MSTRNDVLKRNLFDVFHSLASFGDAMLKPSNELKDAERL